LPNDIEAALNEIAIDVLQDYTGHPRVAAFWMPRLERFLSWFAATEPERRQGVHAVVAETTGTLVLSAPGGPFTLTARADRIDMHAGGMIITDYKTGAIPSNASVESTKAPQLPLEAAIAISGEGFAGTSGRAVGALRYIRASGGEPPGEDRKIRTSDMAALAERAQKGLEALVAEFDDPSTPYRAIRRAGFSYDYDDYAHLARVAEWSAYDDDEGQ
jgi:ATP-dependent helicase/nuclease subunit B